MLKVSAGLVGESLAIVLEGLRPNDATTVAIMEDPLILKYGQSLVSQQLNSELYRVGNKFIFLGVKCVSNMNLKFLAVLGSPGCILRKTSPKGFLAFECNVGKLIDL